MRLDPDGAQLFPQAFPTECLRALERALSPIAGGRPGTRLGPPRDGEGDRAQRGGGGPELRTLLAPPNAIAAALLGPAARPVRAVFFDKSPERNWALGWHQDRVIAVRERREVPGFADWTVKSGIPHVVPPFEVLERTLTLRIHLDDAGPANAPLLVVPGSHRLGRIVEPDIPRIVGRLGAAACPARRGDVWAYATSILHASERAQAPTRRRVLQLLYSAEELPGGLEWLGV